MFYRAPETHAIQSHNSRIFLQLTAEREKPLTWEEFVLRLWKQNYNSCQNMKTSSSRGRMLRGTQRNLSLFNISGNILLLSLQGEFSSLWRRPSTDESMHRHTVNKITRGLHHVWLCSAQSEQPGKHMTFTFPALLTESPDWASPGQLGWKGWAWLSPSSTVQSVCLCPSPLSFGLGLWHQEVKSGNWNKKKCF